MRSILTMTVERLCIYLVCIKVSSYLCCMFLLQRSSNAAQSLCDLIRLSRDHMSQLQENADQDPLLDAVQRWVLLYCVVQQSVNRLSKCFCQIEYTAISRKFGRINVHATIPNGNMGYDQYTVSDDCTCRTYFCCFPLALANTFLRPFVQISLRTVNLKPPTMPFGIVTCTFSDNLSQNSCI